MDWAGPDIRTVKGKRRSPGLRREELSLKGSFWGEKDVLQTENEGASKLLGKTAITGPVCPLGWQNFELGDTRDSLGPGGSTIEGKHRLVIQTGG